MKIIYLAGGCFWGIEKYLSLVNGVVETEVGYANGKTEHPTYEEVCTCKTGHAETAKISYNPSVITLESLLSIFYDSIDPTAVNKQGEDVGTQYRTGIYFIDDESEKIAKESIDNLQKKYDNPIAIELMPLKNYYKAEEYHQKYLDKNPNGYCHIPLEMFEKAKAF